MLRVGGRSRPQGHTFETRAHSNEEQWAATVGICHWHPKVGSNMNGSIRMPSSIIAFDPFLITLCDVARGASRILL